MGILDDVGDGLEGLYQDGKKQVGKVVDQNAHMVGGMLDFVGLHGAANTVDNWGDSVADSLGAQVGEKQLGQSDDPKDLVHGDAKALSEAADHLRTFHDAFEETGSGLRAMDSSHWQGQAADAFRTRFAPHPGQWLTAADACAAAAQALDGFSHTVTWAQGQAQQAIDAYNAARKAHQQAQDAYNASVDSFNKAAKAWNDAARSNPDPGPKPTDPGDFHDPSTGQLAHAQDLLREARAQRDAAAGSAAKALQTATATAPTEPSFTQRMKLDSIDAAEGGMVGVTHVYGGIAKGAADIVDFGRGLNPMDPYNATHPATYLDHVNQVAVGLVHAEMHPTDVVKSLVGSGWGSDPAEAGGKLFLNAVFGAATGGSGEAATAAETVGVNATKDAAETAAKNAAEDAGGGAGRNAVKDPNVNGRQPGDRCRGGDPIDMATGYMTLSQTDAHLAGVLPLLFTRTHDSHYRAGRWLGPSWACTLDERLEIDEEGVVLLRADSIALAYPHPAPGLPTLPSTGARWPLAVDAEGRYTVANPVTGQVRVFRPDPTNPLLAPLDSITDRVGHQLVFEYDHNGAPMGIRHSAGYHLEVDTADYRITALRAGGVELVRYGYTDGHLTEVVNSSGLPMRFEYDAAGRMTAWIDRNSSRYGFVYDDQDRCIAQGGANGHLRWSYEYRPGQTLATDSLGAVNRFEVNQSHQITAHTDPLGHTTRFTRDAFHRLLSVTDPLGRANAFEYDAAGNVVMVTRPDGARSFVTYSTLNLPLTVITPDGSTWRQTYDEHGNRTSVTDPAGATAHFVYDAAGHLAASTNVLGHTARVQCDPAGLVLAAVDPLGGTVAYRRDSLGRPVAVTDPVGGTTLLVWNPEGLLTSRTTSDGATESWTHDGEGNTLTHTDQLGATTTFEYTDFDLLSARTSPDGARHTFTHDTELRLIEVTNPQGLTWTYQHDRAGRLTAETDFDGRTLAYTHDAAGQLAARTNGLGETISYTYDLLGNLTAKDVEGDLTSYTHDALGHLLTATGPAVVLTRTLDPLGRLLTETVNGRTLTNTYDPLGRRTSRTTPGGTLSTWAYDPAGNPLTLTTAGRTLTFDHDAAGRETARHLTDTVTLSSTYDPLGRRTTQALTTGPDVLQHRAYRYRADGNLTAIDDRTSGTRRFDLDAAGRVTAVHATDWTERYAYDDAGNLTHADWPARDDSAHGPRSYTGTGITAAGRIRYTHDTQGRVTTRRRRTLSGRTDTWHYTWDAEDRLIAVTTPDGIEWLYHYDPFGRRIAKQCPATAEWTLFTWDGPTLAEQTAQGPTLPGPYTLTWDHDGLHPLTQTEHLATSPDQQEVDRRFFAIVTDLIGTPTHLLNPDGTTAWEARTTLWGTTTQPKGATTTTPLRFPGQYHDPETRLHYNLHRHYDPESARYLSVDPLGLRAAPNAKSYVHNPTIWADPLGLAPDDCSRGLFDFRSPNPDYPPNSDALAELQKLASGPRHSSLDCSEIAEQIKESAGGAGQVIRFAPVSKFDEIVIPEKGGSVLERYDYHEVFSDGRYVYDPDLSSTPVPLGDYERALRGLNPRDNGNPGFLSTRFTSRRPRD
ncbi:putative T7SS-secreted protein [Kitasatospora sp. GAS1066B]|uniref:putative T7SS-secreted protein n=1 Tax=Kitasatospora sp. GAS1066B TaxID=3156271 RepID=UPI0035132DD1